MHVKQYSSLCERLNPLRKIKYMDYRKRIKIIGHCGIFAIISSAAAAVARLKKCFNNGNSAKSAKNSPPAPQAFSWHHNEMFAIQFCFARNIPFRPFRIFPIAFNKKVLIQADF